MSSDIRICCTFPMHPKTLKLSRRLGDGAVMSLLRLWVYTRLNFPVDGVLKGMDTEDIEIAAGWNGELGRFVAECKDIGWLDCPDPAGPYECHDWIDHQPWSTGEEQRGDTARFKRLAQVAPEEYKRLKKAGVTSIAKDDYESLFKGNRPTASKQPAISPAERGEQPAPFLSKPDQTKSKTSSSSPVEKLPPPPTPAAEEKAVMTTGRFSIFEFRNAYQQATGTLMPGGLNQQASELCLIHPRDKLEDAFRVMAECGGRTLRYLVEILDGKPKQTRASPGDGRSAERRKAAENVLARLSDGGEQASVERPAGPG